MSNNVPTRYRVTGFKQLTALTTAASFANADIPAGTTAVLLQAAGQNVRWRGDGTAPTASIGMRLLTTANPTLLEIQSIGALSFIQESATATLEATFLGH